MDVRIVFDERDLTTTFTDTVETGEVRVVVTYPDDIMHDLGKSLKASTDWMVEVPSRTDIFGKIMQGEYTVLVERYDVGGTTPTDTETVTFTLAYSPIAEVTETWDVFTPNFRLTDSTTYSRSGFLTVAPQSRLWEANNGGTHEWEQDSLNFLSLYDGGFFTGDYEWSLTVAITSVMDNNYVEIISEETITGTKTIKNPPMLEEIYALMACLFGKMKAKECCKDASYEKMKEDWIYASSLLFNFVLGGQAGNTAQLSDILNGTDCQDGILTILKRWGCYDETITETAIAAYDFCLCSEGGGAAATDREAYDAGNGAIITSDATATGEKWTFAVASGVGTFTQNLAGSRIFGGTIHGDSGTATHTSNGATNSFKLVLPIPGTGINTGYATALLSSIGVWSTTGANPTANAPWVQDQGSVERRVVDVSSGTISVVFTGIGATYPDGWAITFELP